MTTPARLKTIDDALSLPRGRLFHNLIEMDFADLLLMQAANQLICANDQTVFYSRAHIIAHASNRFGWSGPYHYTFL